MVKPSYSQIKCWVMILLYAVIAISVTAQEINPSILLKQWSAFWIAVPAEPPKEYGVYWFRKNLQLPQKPASFTVHVSADNRYKLFVNSTLVSLGPARGDLFYWNFETTDLAPYLNAGNNIITAIVWNDGDMRPEGQISNRTAFVLQGDSEKESVANTNSSWKCIRSNAYKPLPGIGYPAYYVAGPGELVDMNQYTQDWMNPDFDDSQWKEAAQIGWRGASPKGISDINSWMLVPSPLPQMERKLQRFQSVRTATGIQVPPGFPSAKTALNVPSFTHAVLLIDQTFLSNAYPTIIFSKGKDADISIQYAEALFESMSTQDGFLPKGNRDEVEGKIFKGRRDSILSNGLSHQNFTSLSWRTFRYIQLTINTKNEPLEIEDFYSTFTGYPFQFKATLKTDNTMMLKMMEIGWRTARSCAMETYMDCPYYEQLQYIGDTRIQALVSLYNSGDDRLVRNAISQMDHSRMAEGITLSRHPSFSPQQVPTFSLWYIGMLHDYWMYRGDSSFIEYKLHGTRDVLWFFSKYQQQDGSLKSVPYWMYTDWVDNRRGWDGGTPPFGSDGCSSVLDLQLLWALQLAADMEIKLGSASVALEYKNKALQLQNTIRKKYWDIHSRLFADTRDKDLFSQHANALAILTNTIAGPDATALAKKILVDSSLAPASIYFKYYLHMACTQAGLGGDYLKWLSAWEQNINMGLTTWAEMPNIAGSRSDCHAWGASPNIEFFRTVLGIDSDAPGFAKVKIVPHLGSLKSISGTMPHPLGTLSVSYRMENGKWKIAIGLPNALSGYLMWKGKKYALKPGANAFDLI
ncbi:MAG TPA: alpha-L-rhamnosidase C-terminal domain-containing protein [Puia sp.]|jgi:alpha-L-rhamnosidase|nr:alpha-L-rhamnosidase C-terminal domain-containing protein [Puia sp.]